MSVQRLTVTCRVDDFTGYGKMAIQLVRGIASFGYYPQIRSLGTSEMFGAKVPVDIRERFVGPPQPEATELLIHPPNLPPTPGKKTILYTMWEATRLRPTAVAFLNASEHVITPSWWGASCFSASGVDRPIRVIPLGVDSQVFHYRRNTEPRCVFGCSGRMAHGGVRKGINEVIDVFQKAFPSEKDVHLKVKVFPDCPVTKISDPRITIDQAYWSDSQIADWLGSLTCFVSLARLEGFGLLQLQSLAVGRPVISIIYGGVAEFLTRENSYPIDFRLVPAELAYAGCGHWANPSEDHAIEQMRRVYRSRHEAEHKGLLGSQDAHRLTWAKTAEKTIALLHEVGALIPP